MYALATRPATRYAPDVELMLQVRNDEPGAFAELLDRFWPCVFGRLLRQLGDRQEAEDLTQDVFLRLYRSRRRYQPRAKFATWLFHITNNVARNAIRGRKRRPLVSLGYLTPPSDGEGPDERVLADHREAPTRPLERAETVGAVRAAMAALHRRQRTALELQFQDRSYSEIADELHMTPKAAKSLLYRARLQLRENLDRYMRPDA